MSCHIAGTVTEEGDLLALERINIDGVGRVAFKQSEDIGVKLARVVEVGQTINNRYAGMLSKFFDDRVFVSPDH